MAQTTAGAETLKKPCSRSYYRESRATRCCAGSREEVSEKKVSIYILKLSGPGFRGKRVLLFKGDAVAFGPVKLFLTSSSCCFGPQSAFRYAQNSVSKGCTVSRSLRRLESVLWRAEGVWCFKIEFGLLCLLWLEFSRFGSSPLLNYPLVLTVDVYLAVEVLDDGDGEVLCKHWTMSKARFRVGCAACYRSYI